MNKFKTGDLVDLTEEKMSTIDDFLLKIIEEEHPFTIKSKVNSNTYSCAGMSMRVFYFKERDLYLRCRFDKKEYTYEDLCNSPIGTKVTFEKGEILFKIGTDRYESHCRSRKDQELKGFKDCYNNSSLGKIIKIEEPTYTTVYEAEKEILDEVEKEYLRAIIKPFRDRVKWIKKSIVIKDKAYIAFCIRDDANFNLPNFDKYLMYKNMEYDKEYTLEQLGL